MKHQAPLKLSPALQHYAWGKIGASLVKTLSRSTSEKPHAELWYGAHPSAPSLVSGKKLTELIAADAQGILGKTVAVKFGTALPFLFKVLSIGEPLSIQAHPNKTLAKVLHARDPKNYPDENHKPEIAICVTELELIYGFKSEMQITAALEQVPELKALTGDKTSLPEMFLALFSAGAAAIEEQTRALESRLSKLKDPGPEDRWALTLCRLYPAGDAGIFCLYLMNYGRLAPGEALFTQPHVPHAYLSGELVEVMANSDNVVRAGLTKKFVDRRTLLTMLNFDQRPIPVLKPQKENDHRAYASGAEEFSVQVYGSDIDREVATGDKVELVFVLSGSATAAGLSLGAGEAALIPGSIASYKLQCKNAQLFRVFVP